jgi:hypothetical protein
MDVSKVSTISLQVDGMSIPASPLKIEKNLYMDAYQQLCSATGTFDEDRSVGISRLGWAGGYGLFCFELAPNQFDKRALPLIKSANVRLNIVWNECLLENVNIIIYAKSPSVMSVEHTRNITL